MHLLLLDNAIIALLGGAIGRSVAPIKDNSALLRQFLALVMFPTMILSNSYALTAKSAFYI